MEFRWLIFLTLWTVFSGPILARPSLPRVNDRELAANAQPMQTSHRR